MNKTVKTVLAVMLSVLLVASCFAGCTGNSAGKYKIGICQLVQHDALDKATEGFKKGVIDTLGEDKVVFEEQIAAGDSATCATICNGFVSSGVDLIMANATASLQAAAAATTTIPIVSTSVTDFATALDISDWNGTTGRNIIGTSDLSPIEEQANMIKEVFPDVKQVGILYCSAEPNSVFQVNLMTKSLDKLGIAHKEFSAADTNDINAVVTSACGECDVLYVPTDNTLASCAETVKSVSLAAGVPIVVGEEENCKNTGQVTLSISYYDIGYEAGKMAADILANGADPATMEVKTSTDLVKKYVPSACEALGVTPPADYVAIEEN